MKEIVERATSDSPAPPASILLRSAHAAAEKIATVVTAGDFLIIHLRPTRSTDRASARLGFAFC